MVKELVRRDAACGSLCVKSLVCASVEAKHARSHGCYGRAARKNFAREVLGRTWIFSGFLMSYCINVMCLKVVAGAD